MENDAGHSALIADLSALLEEAKDFEFHDFKNSKYAAPKMELMEKILVIADKVKGGGYDN